MSTEKHKKRPIFFEGCGGFGLFKETRQLRSIITYRICGQVMPLTKKTPHFIGKKISNKSKTSRNFF